MNPAPAPEGKLNPFAIPEVRQAMQYLVDRDFIAQDIYQGLAQPMITQVSPSDYDFLTVYDIDRGSGIRFDPEYARQQIADAMTAAGAELVDGTWSYQGEPIRLKFIARVEDERREIGDLVRSELEAAGFQVNITYQSFAPAVLSVYSTDPAAFEWHLYTEGWSRGGAQRYDAGSVNSFIAPWLGNMPGWREQGFWQYENATADELGQKLYKGQFASQAERDDLYRQLTQIGLDESVRVWLATVNTTFAASDQLANMTRDVSSGSAHPVRAAQRHDARPHGHQRGRPVGLDRAHHLEPGGRLRRRLQQRHLAQHGGPGGHQRPVHGLHRAVPRRLHGGDRGPRRDPGRARRRGHLGRRRRTPGSRWRPAPRPSAPSPTTCPSTWARTWHDGQPITLADAFYSIAQGFDLAYDPDKSRVEVALAATSRPFLETIKGYRINDDDTVTVYVDYWHFDENMIASYASPTSFAMPWELLAAMDDLVFDQRRAAYSDTAASRQNVPWLSLVMTRDAKLVDRTLRELGLKKTIPAGYFQVGDRTLVTEDEAVARYDAARAFFDEHGHYVISSGPYVLNRYDPAAQYAELSAFRDPSYPFTATDFQLGDPPTLAIADPTARPGRAWAWTHRSRSPSRAPARSR